jgi:thiol-disulfide isomerase/thioredoxin
MLTKTALAHLPIVRAMRYLAPAALALASAVLLQACDSAALASGPAPESRFVLLDGSSMASSALKGRVTLVNFWATSCTTCVAEMPQMIDTYNKYQAKGFDTVAVAMAYDPPAYVVNYAQTRKLPFKVAIDNTGANAKAWGDVKLTPTTFIVNKRGDIVKRYVGTPDFMAMQGLIEKLLAEAS